MIIFKTDYPRSGIGQMEDVRRYVDVKLSLFILSSTKWHAMYHLD